MKFDVFVERCKILPPMCILEVLAHQCLPCSEAYVKIVKKYPRWNFSVATTVGESNWLIKAVSLQGSVDCCTVMLISSNGPEK